MTDQAAIVRIVADCERYWRETGVPGSAIRDMRMQLEQHLVDAGSDGVTPEQVVGRDLAEFAEAWASEYREPSTDPNRWTDVTSGASASRRGARWELITYTAGALALVAGALAGSRISGGDSVDTDTTWRWVWTLLAVGMGIGEMFTAGFFLLPFAIGALAAAVLAWVSVGGLLTQWLVFFGVSAISFGYLRRYVARQDEKEQPRVGANRWVGAIGVVLSDVDPHTGSGMVRIDGEEWRATTDVGSTLDAGIKVTVTDVRGARLVVEPIE